MNAYNPLESSKRVEATGLVKLDAALAKQTVRLGGLLAGIVAVSTAILGLLISIK